MTRAVKRLLILIGLAAVLVAGVHAYAAWRLHSALREAGMSQQVSVCMTRRLMKRLDLLQLRKLQKLEGDKPSLDAWVRAVDAVDDREVVLVTASSAALCSTGLAR